MFIQQDNRVEPFIEVLICTHNRVDLLRRALTYLNQANRPEGVALSIFVAANACSDATINYLDFYIRNAAERDLLDLKYISVPTPGKSLALNESIDHLSGQYIACVDDDHRVALDFFEKINNASLRHSDVTFFCGKILPDWDGSEPEWVHETGPLRIYPLPIPRFEHGDDEFKVMPDSMTPGGGNLVLKKEMFKRVGAFDSNLGPVGHDLGGAEDIEWVKRALRLGEVLHYVPSIVQFHYVDGTRLTTSYILRKAYGRTLSTMKIRADIGANAEFPLYMIRKIFGYTTRLMFCLSSTERRYYLVRTTATLAEIVGFLQRRKERRLATNNLQ